MKKRKKLQQKKLKTLSQKSKSNTQNKKQKNKKGCSFLKSKKNEKTFGVTQTPNPGALGEAGQEVNSDYE